MNLAKIILFRNSSKDEGYGQLTNSTSKSTIDTEPNTPSDISSNFDFTDDRSASDSATSNGRETGSVLSIHTHDHTFMHLIGS